jgi:nucleotide-binding universal stress UspA family protein
VDVRTILHPTDHATASRAALRYAVALAHDYAARLLILHVVPGSGLGSLPSVEHRPVGDGRVPVEYLLAQGDPVANVLRTARERGCDLIVLGSRPAYGWRRWFRRGRAERIVRSAPCPVLVVTPTMPPPLPASALAQPGGTQGLRSASPLQRFSSWFLSCEPGPGVLSRCRETPKKETTHA